VNEAIYVIQNPEQASTMLQPLRLRILELASEPASATSLAPALGVPRQHVNYHLRELERAGLVEFVEERKRGNCIERLYRSIARSYVIAPAALTGVGADPGRVQDRASSEYLVALGARLIQDVSEIRAESVTSPTLAIETEIAFESDEARGQFAKELAGVVSDLAGKYHGQVQGSTAFRMVIAIHRSSPEGARRA
jgi:DNA-binding transcriptional ArsR family regulator